MAYKLLDIKLTPGSLNLAAPGDQIPETDCLDLTGWWQSSAGQLLQGQGYQNLSAYHPGISLDSICQVGNRIYYGGSGNLYQVGRNSEAALTGSYDGLPLGMISFQGYLWVINKSLQSKDDGTTLSAWTPPAPAAPTVTNPGLTSAAIPISECDPDPTTQLPSGPYTHINVFTPTGPTGGVDNVLAGGAITISGNISTIYNHTWTVETVHYGSKLPDGTNAGQSLVVVLGSLSKDALPSPIPAGGPNAGSFTYANPGVVPGSHVYYITWQYADLGESNPSPPVTFKVPSNGSKITISIASLTPPAGTTGWNVYRQSPAMSWPYVVNAKIIPIATTSYDDFGDAIHSQDDTFLTDDLGKQLEFNHDQAPKASVMANQVYNGRIVVANGAVTVGAVTTQYPNRIWYTPSLQPGFFRGSQNPNGGDWVDVGTDRGDAILYIAVKPQQLIVYRQKSIWRILYDFEDINSRIEAVVPELGVVGPRAVACSSQGDYFRAPEGIYKFNGDWAAKVSRRLDPVFVGTPSENFAVESPGASADCALGLHAGRLWVSYTYQGSFGNGSSFVYDTASDRWFDKVVGFDCFLDVGYALLGSGGVLGRVVQLETGYADAASGTILTYQSAYQDCGLPDHEKTFADLIIHHNTQGQTFTFPIRTNRKASAADAFALDATINSTALTRTIIPLVYPAAYSVTALRGQPIRARTLSVRLIGTGPSVAPPVTIQAPILLHYYIEARNGFVYDTDETDHGMPGVVKVVSEVEFDIDARNGPGALQIYSDIPGGSMVARLATPLVIPQTTTRQLVRIVITPTIDGKLLRYVATTTTGFNIYGFRARVTPIGVYVDGSITETWDHRATPVGI